MQNDTALSGFALPESLVHHNTQQCLVRFSTDPVPEAVLQSHQLLLPSQDNPGSSCEDQSWGKG